ncbi:MAG: insulinase family protein [Verrucomicrobia bacterium]|nr:insulinase family protein [Verrucomicrobiota bacterium]MCH8525560.1 insulinase family protein [Kiritimatiellia bacterium]
MLSPQHPAFTFIQHRTLPLQNAEGFLYEHRSGAKVLSLVSPDDNKVFGITFRTPRADHTGLPHILEHSVLCGSEKYPVKEPFKELLKTSLQTYLNAFTYPDRTCYPVASCNPADFYHLMDVYLDAVFFPRLTPAVLGQEGWRLQKGSRGGYEFQGVVYNEMKGVYASADSRWEDISQQALFPDSLYRFDYGGAPAHIPDLTFEAFQQFHRDHYHPANAFVYFYGDDDPLERLNKLDAFLSRARPGPVPPPVALQPAWTQTRRLEGTYPAGEHDDEGVFASMNWLFPGTCLDLDELLLANMVNYLLTRNPASPLRIALLESGLGEDLLGGSINTHLLQPSAAYGLRGVEPGSEDAVIDLLLKSLETIARDGFRTDLIEGAFNSTEFYFREQNTGGTPKGLVTMLQTLNVWINGGDPLDALQMESRIRALRVRWEKEPALFTDWIRTHLLENTSRAVVIVRPDPALEARELADEATRIAEFTTEFARKPEAEARNQQLIDAVDRFQSVPDSPEALKTLPRLRLNDVNHFTPDPPLDIHTVSGVPVLAHTLGTAGILYIDLLFDVRDLDSRDLPLLSLYSRCLTELGTRTLDHIQFNEQLSCHTGGLSAQIETSETLKPDGMIAELTLRVKTLHEKIPATFALLRQMLCEPLLGPPERVHQLLLEEKSNEESNLIHNGSRVISLRLLAAFSPAERASEEMGGLCYLEALRNWENDPVEALTDRLQHLHRTLIRTAALKLHLGGQAEGVTLALDQLPEFLDAIPDGPAPGPCAWTPLTNVTREGLVIPSAVNFVGLATRLRPSETLPHASVRVATRLLRNDYLWDHIRVRGGAYGASCSFDRISRVFSFTSYRDPHVEQSLETYRQSAQWLAGIDLSDNDLEQAVIGTLGTLSRPHHPAQQSHSALIRHLIGLTGELRQQQWDEVRATTAADLRRTGEELTAALEADARVCVLGSRNRLNPPRLALNLREIMG